MFFVLFLLLTTTLIALLTKLMVWLARRYTLAWRHAFAYGALVMAAGIAGMLIRSVAGQLPAWTGLPVGLLFHLALGGWFFGRHVRRLDGQAIGFKGGAAFGAAIFGTALLLGVLFGMLQGFMLVRHGPGAPGF